MKNIWIVISKEKNMSFGSKSNGKGNITCQDFGLNWRSYINRKYQVDCRIAKTKYELYRITKSSGDGCNLRAPQGPFQNLSCSNHWLAACVIPPCLSMLRYLLNICKTCWTYTPISKFCKLLCSTVQIVFNSSISN